MFVAEGQVQSLLELSAQAVAGNIAFEEVEHFYPPIPEQLQLRIAFWSFPENEEDIRYASMCSNLIVLKPCACVYTCHLTLLTA